MPQTSFPLRALTRSAATDGQFVKWDDGLARWIPATVASSSPAGASTELQYRNGAAFGAVTGSSWSGTLLGLPKTSIVDNSADVALTIEQNHAAGFGVLIIPGNDDTNAALTINDAASLVNRHRFFGNGDAMLAMAGGKVVIGGTSADGTFHVWSGSAGTVTSNTAADEVTIEGSGNAGLSILTPNGSYGSLFFGSPTNNAGCQVAWSYNANVMTIGTLNDLAQLSFQVGNALDAMRLTPNSGTLEMQLSGVSSMTTRPQADLNTAWIDSTDATRKARLILKAYDTASREFLRGWGDGSTGRIAVAAPASAPTDAHLAASQISFYLDEAGHNLLVRAKYADGTTLKLATIALA